MQLDAHKIINFGEWETYYIFYIPVYLGVATAMLANLVGWVTTLAALGIIVVGTIASYYIGVWNSVVYNKMMQK